MLGLIEKDIRLLGKRKQTLIIFIIIAIIMAATQDGFFAVSYMTFLCSFFTIGTVAFDEADNGYQFIMTLPVERKHYVLEKYVLSIGACVVGWVVSVVVAMIAMNFVTLEGMENFNPLEASVFIPICMIFVAIMLPIQIIFGAEKGRIVLALFAGGIVLLIGFARKSAAVNTMIANLMTTDFSKIAPWQIGIAVVIIALIALAVSYLITAKYIEKKEF